MHNPGGNTFRTDSVLRELASSQPLRLRIQGDCMFPALKDGDAVMIRNRPIYWPGDILVFRGRKGQILIHRLLGFFPRRTKIDYLTKADAAINPDTSIPYQQIIGKVEGINGCSMLSHITLLQRLCAFGYFIRFIVIRMFAGRLFNGLR